MDTALDPQKFDPHDPAYTRDPYAWYKALREQEPVHFVPLYQSNWLFRYNDVRRVLDEKELFLKNNPNEKPTTPVSALQVTDYLPSGVFSMDPPRHDEIRTIVDPLFADAITSAATKARQVAQAQLRTAKASRRMELVQQYAVPVPSAVLMHVLGISQPDPDQQADPSRPNEAQVVCKWVEMILAGNDPTMPTGVRVAAKTCAMALNTYFQAFPRCPAHQQKGGLVQAMATQGTKQGMLPEEVQSTALNLVVAGYLSTVFLIATGTWNLINNPSQLALLRKEPARMKNAIEEMLRFDAPAQLVDRYLADDVELSGKKLKRGDKVTGVLGSANRDKDKFPNPDTFDIMRDTTGHVGFGAGIHHCIGAPLVRVGAPVAFQELLDALPVMALGGIPQWQTDPYLRSVSNLPLAIG